MTAVLPPPTPVRAAMFALGVVGLLAGLSGLITTAIVAGLTSLDPLLGGDVSLSLAVAAIGLGLTGIGALLPIVGALNLGEGRPAGRWLLGLSGVGLLLTPLLPVGAWMLYVATLDVQSVAWFDRLQAERDRPPQPPSEPVSPSPTPSPTPSPPEPEAAT